MEDTLMEMVNWGIMSAANIAFDEVVPALRRSSRAIVKGIATKTPQKAKRFQIENVFTSYEELINDEHIHAIYIPLPNSLHAEWAIKAMERGKHVLLEKPAALTEKEMYNMKEVAESSNVILMEAFMYQFHKQHKRVKELLESKIIGEYRHLKAHFSWMLPDENDIRLNPDLGGGAMRDVGCYGFHALTQIIGFKPVSVSMTGSLKNVRPDNPGVDLTSTCVLIDEQERTATITASMELPFLDRYEIIGELGAITLNSSFRPDLSVDKRGKLVVKDKNGIVTIKETFEDDQYLNQIEHFQDCILEGEKPIYNMEQSVEMSRFLEKSYKSLYNNSSLTKI